MVKLSKTFLAALIFLSIAGCSSDNKGENAPVYSLTLEFTRIDQAGLDPFTVTATLKKDGANLSGETLTLDVPDGAVSAVIDNGDGTYDFTVTPSATGVYPVNVSYLTASISRSAVVVNDVGASVGQPLAVPGAFVNTEGYEDGLTITPDGQYLFVHYGPIYFSGILFVSTLCADVLYSLYNLNDCDGRPNSEWLFSSKGPYSGPMRPNFPDARISAGTIKKGPYFSSRGVDFRGKRDFGPGATRIGPGN